MDKRLLESIENKKKELDELRPFSKSALERLRKQIIVEWTFNSNAIEGNTLTIRETELILNEGITISGKPLREHFEALNHRDAILFLEDIVQKKKDLTEEILMEIHRMILKNIDDEEAGRYRTRRVRILGAIHIPPDPLKISGLMKEFFNWYSNERNKLHPIELSSLLHYKLVHIHPFIDGNGRTARLLMNLILMRYGYPPAVVLKVDRRKYYKVLKEADSSYFENYLNFIAKSVERSLIIYLQALKPVDKDKYDKQGYISLSSATKYCKYSQEYLSLLARRGKLSAIKFNRNWMTTKEALEDYIKSKITK